MHDYSLPRSDRLEASAPTPDQAHRHARVLALADSSFFRAFRRRGQIVTTKSIRQAALFGLAATEALERTQRKLKRLGIAGNVVDVRVIVGST